MMFKAQIVVFTFISLLLFSFKAGDQPSDEGHIKWITFEEAVILSKKKPKKILVDVYTDWCGWCKVMDRETFKDKAVTDYINKKYYAVKLDAEQKGTIKLGDKQFKYLEQGGRGINEIALALTNNQPSYPTTVFLDDKFNMIQPLPGYLKAKEFHQIITFFGEDYHKKQDFESYKAKTYGSLYPAK